MDKPLGGTVGATIKISGYGAFIVRALLAMRLISIDASSVVLDGPAVMDVMRKIVNALAPEATNG